MDLRTLAGQVIAIEKGYWLGLITQEDAIAEIAWLEILWQEERSK